VLVPVLVKSGRTEGSARQIDGRRQKIHPIMCASLLNARIVKKLR
jgi:hypothetical protein